MPYFILCSSFMVCFYGLHTRLAHNPLLDFVCCGLLALFMCFVCPLVDRKNDNPRPRQARATSEEQLRPNRLRRR